MFKPQYLEGLIRNVTSSSKPTISFIGIKRIEASPRKLGSCSSDVNTPAPRENVSISPSLKATPGHVVVLDSSFNPPTLAHGSIFHQTLESVSKIYSPSWILGIVLLSCHNLDKKEITGASLSQRLSLMSILKADVDRKLSKIRGSHPVQVVVGLTNCGKFVEKSSVIQHHLSEAGYAPFTKIHFAMGFDTVVRFFNPKYYLAATESDPSGDMAEPILQEMKTHLDPFFKRNNSHISYASRGEESPLGSSTGEFSYLAKLTDTYKDRLHHLEVPVGPESRPSLSEISSTKVRSILGSQGYNPEELGNYLSPKMREAILDLGIYS